LKKMIEMGGSDLHITTNSAPRLRVHGRLRPLDMPRWTERTPSLLPTALTDAQNTALKRTWELDSPRFEELWPVSVATFSISEGRCSVFRTIPWKSRLDALGLPQVVKVCATSPRTRPRDRTNRSGKSTTLAAMLDKINSEREEHMITIEDPIEFLHNHKKCLVNRVKSTRHAFLREFASRRASRRPGRRSHRRNARPRNIESALRIAETGHLTFATLHTNSAASTINRIIDVFPSHQQPQIRAQLSMVMERFLSGVLRERMDVVAP